MTTSQPGAPLGRRVVVRRRLRDAESGHRFTDLLGRLEATGDPIVLRRDDGSTTSIPAAEVHRMKVVPAGRADILRLEEIAATGWPAVETQWLGRWLLRAAGGWTSRANSVLPLGDPGRPVAEAIAAVRQWYADRGLAAEFAVPLPAAAPLDAELGRAGYAVHKPTLMLTAPLRSVQTGPGRAEQPADRLTADLLPAVRLTAVPDDRWLAAYSRAEGAVSATARQILTGGPNPVFASVVTAGGDLVAIGRGVVGAGWLGISGLEVHPDHRRRGLAGQVTTALVDAAARLGATEAYLQVTEDNAAALALYHRLGFTRHHRYHYRLLPAEH